MKFKLETYALAFTLAVIEILKTILSPGTKLQVDGSAAPVAIPVCHDDDTPVDTGTADPQAVRPVAASLR